MAASQSLLGKCNWESVLTQFEELELAAVMFNSFLGLVIGLRSEK